VFLEITTTHRPATDIGYLLHKNPARVQRFEQSYGAAHVFYPEATDERCTVALLVDVDPVGLVRSRRGRGQDAGMLAEYVNDRPYAASSLLSVAMGAVFRAALAGRSDERPALVATPIPLAIDLPAVPSRGGERLLHELFAPLGYEVQTSRLALDPAFPSWGPGAYFGLRLTGRLTLQDALAHLYVLLPVLDDAKHYWVDESEVDKLLRHGERWLATHLARELIVRRYLRRRRALTDLAFERLAEIDDAAPDDVPTEGDEGAPAVRPGDAREQGLETPIRLNDARLATVAAVAETIGATSVVDLGCGEGRLLRKLLENRRLASITGLDVSSRALEIARERLRWDRLPARDQQRLTLLHGALTYRDDRIAGRDLATAVEVIEHLDPSRLAAFERVVFECAAPGTVVVTTPNVEYNVNFAGMAPGALRHPDHRFEWTREQFGAWAARVAARFGYEVRFDTIGTIDPVVGAPTQMAIFTRARAAA
jgi:3' terminal RNA ribose 2'-O-methyltransferase Hen1